MCQRLLKQLRRTKLIPQNVLTFSKNIVGQFDDRGTARHCTFGLVRIAIWSVYDSKVTTVNERLSKLESRMTVSASATSQSPSVFRVPRSDFAPHTPPENS